MNIRILTATAAAALLTLGLAACTSAPTVETSNAAAPAATAGDEVSISDAWVKSAPEGMSAAFGQLVNAGDSDVTVVSATSEASPMIELHETVANDTGEMVMRAKEGGFVIPARGTFDLTPGGNHIMLMGLQKPLVAGEETSFTLTFSDDSTYTFTAPVKDYSGANETYEGDGGMKMDMGSGN